MLPCLHSPATELAAAHLQLDSLDFQVFTLAHATEGHSTCKADGSGMHGIPSAPVCVPCMRTVIACVCVEQTPRRLTRPA